MSNELDLTASSTDPEPDPDPTFGIAHPTVNVEYPDGKSETVSPDYDIILANSFPDTEIGETRVNRLELTEAADDLDKSTIREAVAAARDEFRESCGQSTADRLNVELVYFRTVGGEKALCVQLRGPFGMRGPLSQLSSLVDEKLRVAA